MVSLVSMFDLKSSSNNISPCNDSNLLQIETNEKLVLPTGNGHEKSNEVNAEKNILPACHHCLQPADDGTLFQAIT